MSDHFDLVVIGAGPAGEKGAAQAAYFGKRVCLIERAPKPGGAAVNTGTIPSKILRETALYFHGLRQRGMHGLDFRIKPDITLADFMHRERAVVESTWSLIDENIRRHGITTVQGQATFVDAHTIEVTRYGQSPRCITGDFVLLATGARPEPPSGVELDDAVIVDSESILTLDRIPSHMLVVGGGVIACEYASIFAALGVRVTLVTDRPRLLAHLDGEVSEALRQQMTMRLGVTVYVGMPVASVVVDDGHAKTTLADGMQLVSDCVLYAAGRLGNSAGLGLEHVGARVDHRGFIAVDDHYRTAAANVYAAGDVIGFPALASTSMEQARVAVCHAFDLRYKQRVASVLPYGVWTIPEIATVGETEEALLARNVPFEIGRASFRANPRGQISGDVEGFVKLLFHAEDQRLLGASVVGEGAGELIHVAMTCMAFHGTIDFFIQSVFNYPSLGDAYKYAAYDGLQALQRRYARLKGLASTQERAIAR